MKKVLALFLGAALLSGCGAASQVEGQAFVVSLGVDVDGAGRFTVSAQYPSYGSKEAGGNDRGKSDYLLSSGSGETPAAALYALNASIPRVLNLLQIKNLIVSERLASSPDFAALLREIKLSWRVNGEAWLVVASGRAEEFMAVQQPLIGLRLSDTIITALTRFERMGVIPRCSLTEAFCDIESVYGDAVAPMAAVAGEADDRVKEPDAATAGGLPREGDNRDEYFGTALFRGGLMVGRLSGGETQLLRLVRGSDSQMPMRIGDAVVPVKRRGPLGVRVDLTGDAPLIEVAFEVGIEDTREDQDEETVRRVLEEGLDALTARCQSLGVDPFGYTRRAAAQFATLEAWRAYDWRGRFPDARITYRLACARINT